MRHPSKPVSNVEEMMQAVEDFARLAAMLTGAKKQLTDAGWSEPIAEMIVVNTILKAVVIA